MSKLQQTLDSLQPYVISIRYIEGTPVVDVVFKDGWTVIDDANIIKATGNDGMNYYMIYSETKGVGLDDLLEYVDKNIKINLERERKHELLKVKVNELKEVFKKNSLNKLSRLKFTFGEEELVPSITDLDIIEEDIDEAVQPSVTPKNIEPLIEEPVQQIPQTYLDEKGEQLELTDEDREILEEEARAERNRKILQTRTQKNGMNNIAKKVELPPKRKIEMAIAEKDYDADCDCGLNEACEKCIDKKDY